MADNADYARPFANAYASERIITLAGHKNFEIKAEALFCLANAITMSVDDQERARLEGRPSVHELLLSKDHGLICERLVDGLKLKQQGRLLHEILQALNLLVEYPEAVERMAMTPLADMIQGL